MLLDLLSSAVLRRMLYGSDVEVMFFAVVEQIVSNRNRTFDSHDFYLILMILLPLVSMIRRNFNLAAILGVSHYSKCSTRPSYHHHIVDIDTFLL
jgi:hypothetical protein